MYRPILHSDQVYSNLFIHILTKDDNSRFPTCRYYTSSSGSYTSFNYSFFNAPSSDNCSNPQIATGNELVGCNVPVFSLCPKYTPDMSAILRTNYLNPTGNSHVYELICSKQTDYSYQFFIYRVSDFRIIEFMSIVDENDSTGNSQIERATTAYQELLADIYNPSISSYVLHSEEIQFAQKEEKKNNLLLSILK